MFSVVVPVFNHAEYLVTGVLSALRSPLVSEVLLVDDGSRDRSAQLIASLAESRPDRIRDLGRADGNRGAAARLNQLVGAAREGWVAVLNSDDAFVPGRFEAIRACCQDGVEFACGHLLIADERGRMIGTKRGVLQPEYPFPALDPAAKVARGEIADLLANQNFVATTSNMVFTRELYERVGGFRSLRYVHDWDFALRAALLGKVRYLPQYLAVYRSHRRNTIRTAFSEISAEARSLFRDLLQEFPDLPSRPDFALALEGNRYLCTAEDVPGLARHAD